MAEQIAVLPEKLTAYIKEMYLKALELNPDFNEAQVELDKLNAE
jgi:hypothetical protein